MFAGIRRTLVITVLGVCGLAAPALASPQNDRICEREYGKERVEKTVCKALGDRAPKVRDCLRSERERTGRGERDTRVKEVERHAKCFKEAIDRARD